MDNPNIYKSFNLAKFTDIIKLPRIRNSHLGAQKPVILCYFTYLALTIHITKLVLVRVIWRTLSAAPGVIRLSYFLEFWIENIFFLQ